MAKYLLKSIETICAAKESEEGAVTLSIVDDIKCYEQENEEYSESEAWYDGYVATSDYYTWKEITNEQAVKYQKVIDDYNQLLKLL